MKGKLAAGLAGLLIMGAVGTGLALPAMGQMGGMAEMAPRPGAQPKEEREPVKHGTKRADGLEVTLLSAPPLSPEATQRMMPGMGGMQGMGSMMPGIPGMGAPPTHWIGVVVRNVKADRVVQNLQITLTARKEGVTRTVKLMPMPGSYGAHISLPEKGRYTVTVSIARPETPLTLAFDFEPE